jgi:predicted RecB family nuclease
MLKTCKAGHQFYKSSDCPTCPICEAAGKPEQGFLADIGAPARRALERAGITSLAKLSRYRESELLQLHGMGPASLPKLKAALDQAGLTLKRE